MGFFSRLTGSITVNSCSPEQLVEFLAPSNYTGSVISRKAEQRFMQLPTEVQTRALLCGLSNQYEAIRMVCAERLSSFVGGSTEITRAMLLALKDPYERVRYYAARYFDIGVLHTVLYHDRLPFVPSSVIDEIRTAERIETDKAVREMLANAIETLQKFDT